MTVLRRLAGDVWIHPHDPDPSRVQPCVAVIAGGDGSVIVDAGHGPDHARRVRQAVAGAGLPAPRRLVYTHHHWDHVWGACAWPSDVEVIGHRAGASQLREDAGRPWGPEYLRQMVAENPRLEPSCTARAAAMSGQWDDFRVVVPDTVFDESLTLPGGVVVRHVGGKHAPDSTVVAVPDAGVLLLGDAIYPPPLHLREPGDGLGTALIQQLLADYPPDDYQWYADSHDDPKPSALFRDGLR